MTEQRKDAEAIFLAALDKPTPQERAAYVEGACADDTALLQRVRELLQSHDESCGPLDAPPPGLGVTVGLPPILERPGTMIGPYKLLQRIGEGGMGVVYMAEQQEPVRRKVALKIIKPGMDSAQVLARFEAERQALAMMDHQNIARVFDAGTTATGRPYFVMELVHGLPITKFCDDNKLTPRERLSLFVPVCQAIQHAHQKGIIHRDIKPSNVLVTMYDDRPVPKVIDFGVAKAIEQRLTEKTMFTQFGMLVGTFEYMSPEQAEMNALGVDTRSDVYSLGVLLYELLTGTTPLEGKRLRAAALDELVRLIREEEPPRPSARLSGSGTLAKIAAARKTEPARLSRLVRGELDWIVMKSLEKDRTRRYETANGLARDVERYLADEPVEACPPSASYRLRKFARKHKAALVTACAFAVLLIAAAAASSWLAFRARMAAQDALAAQRAALVEREEATAAKEDATVKRQESELSRRELREMLYAANLQLTQAAADSGNLTLVETLLEQQRPRPGEADLRGWEWYYLRRASRPELHSRRFSTTRSAGALSTDGSLYTEAVYDWKPGTDCVLRLWDVATGKELFSVVPFPGNPIVILPRPVMSADGNYLAYGAPVGPGERAGGMKGRFKVWDRRTGKEVLALDDLNAMPYPSAFDRAAKRVAVALRDLDDAKGGGVTIRELATGRELLALPLPEQARSIYGVAFNGDGTRLAALVRLVDDKKRTTGAELLVWDAATGKPAFAAKKLPGLWGALAFSPDDKWLAAGSAGEGPEAELKIWDAATGEERLSLTGHASYLTSLAFSPDGSRLASASGDGKVRVWDVGPDRSKGGAPRRVFPASGSPLWTLAFGADGRTLYSGAEDGTVKEWEAEARDRTVTVRSPGGVLGAVAADASGTRFAGAWLETENGYAVKVWERGGRVVFSAAIPAVKGRLTYSPIVALSPDGTRLALTTRERPGLGDVGHSVGTLVVWDVARRKELLRREGEKAFYAGAAFGPGGRRLAVLRDSSAASSALQVWDLDAGEQTLNRDVTGSGWSVAYSADGLYLSTAAGSPSDPEIACRVTLLDARSGAVLWTRDKVGGRVNALAFDAEARRLAVAAGSVDDAGTVTLLDRTTGRPQFELKGHRGIVRTLTFSPDGRRLVSGADCRGSRGGEARLWDTATGREVLCLKTKFGHLTDMIFTADGRRLYFVGGENYYRSDVEIDEWDATPLPEKPAAAP